MMINARELFLPNQVFTDLIFLLVALILVLVLVKTFIFFFRRKKVGPLLTVYKFIWALFCLSYFLFLLLFVMQNLFTSQTGEEWVRNVIITLVLLLVGTMSWIGPVRGILGLTVKRVKGSGQHGAASVDGWLIESWLGEGAGFHIQSGADGKGNAKENSRG